ncbi:MAG: FCD domain-containing protein [Albidovulum sp.]|nr:FCD domain-containing protein [Albidovulum sp.]MDE0305536.1 FCD domain-containing protein [Albidovulum sp.]
MKFTAVKRRKVHEDVAEQIKNQILSGGLDVGESLPAERSLMQAFNVGRPAVREALLLLQHDGFIEISASGRPVIARPTPSNVVGQLSFYARNLLSSKEGERSFQDARRLFEAAIARNAAEIATEADIACLKATLRANYESIDNLDAFERTDVEFHRAIAEIGKNPVFTALHSAIAEWLSKQLRVSLRMPGVASSSYRSHEEIYDAIKSRQPEKAWQAMDRHLKDINGT